MIARPVYFLALCVAMLVYEGIALWENAGNTISEIIWRASTYHPIVPFAMGFLMGHFFFGSTSFYKWMRG
jgi:hypothetical protein